MNMLKKRMKNEKGMTLVELLAVLVILGIIAAIAVPMITNNIQESRDKADVNEALNIISAAKLASIEENKNTFTIKKDSNDLKGYIDINVDEDQTITVILDNKQWKIKGHPAENVDGITKDENGYVTEAELRAYLKDKDE